MTASDIILYAHSTFGVLGIMASPWVFVEALNASAANHQCIVMGNYTAAVCMLLAGCSPTDGTPNFTAVSSSR